MKRVHYTDSYLMNPQHPVTVNIIGAGGTGSQVLTCMARLDVTLRALGHPGLFVTLYDPDIVTEANIGRQLFGPMDLGLNKAQCLVTRINNFFGNDWKAEARLYPSVLKEVKILGPGCAKCKSTYQVIEKVINENNLDVKLTKIEDITEIMSYNVMGTPAVVVDEVVKIKGHVPSESEIKQIFGI